MEKLTKEEYEVDARVVYHRSHGGDAEAGPAEVGKIGVAFGSEVFWTGSYSFPGDGMITYGKKVEFATELARRWNAGRAALAKEQRE